MLQGYRVLDLTDEKGLLCGRILGDFGADVIKIESPGGDNARNNPPFYKDDPDSEKSMFWFYTNFNKKGMTLNIETEEGIEIFKKLVKRSHFVIESFEPGYMDSLGLSYKQLEEVNPGIIMTSITPFGQTGPYAHYKVTDLISQAMGGLVYILGDSDRPPTRISEPQAFFQGGLQGALGSMVAHYYRVMTGEGQHVDVSIQQAVVLTLMMEVEYWDILKFNYRGEGCGFVYSRPQGQLFHRRVFPCKDGYVYYMMGGGAQIGLIASSKAMVELANREGMALELKDYDWTKYDLMTADQKETDHMLDLVAEFLITKSKAELAAAAAANNIFLAPCYDMKDSGESSQLKARDFWVEAEHPDLGEAITYPGAAMKVSQCPWQVYRRAPLIGEHNEEIYIEELGFSREKLVMLKSKNVI